MKARIARPAGNRDTCAVMSISQPEAKRKGMVIVMEIVVAVTGATGAVYAVRLMEA
jgi:hypothetical protein